MDREQKKAVVAEMKEQVTASSSVIIAHYKGLTVNEVEGLRKKIRELGAGFRVTKNRLAKLAIKDTAYDVLADLFTGPTAIATSEDPISAAKAVVEFAKDNEKFVILGGVVDEKQVGIEEINALAKLPSLDELRAKIIGMISTPAIRLATVTQAPATQVARVCGAYGQKEES